MFSSVPAQVFLVFALCSSSVLSQCPNNLAVFNPNIRTACVNETYFIIPVDILLVQKAVAPYSLLPLPANDKTLFNSPFPLGKHPVLVSTGLQNDIRMAALQIPTPLFSGSLIVPYVDRLSDGKTPFTFSVKSYIGGYEGDDFSAFIPAIVGSAEGTTIEVATFVPDDAAYEEISTSPAEFITQIKDVIVPNPVSGPGVIIEAVDTDFFTATKRSQMPYTTHFFHECISQPLILTNGQCQRNTVYFNQTFTNAIFRTGTVTLYEPGAAFQGLYSGVAGYSASGEVVGYNAEDCTSAAFNQDQAALA